MRDHLPRAHGSNLAGTLIWCFLRALEPLLFLRLFASFPPLSYGALPSSSSSLFSWPPPALLVRLHAARLSPARLVLLGLSTSVAAKQITWHLFLSAQALPPATALGGALAELGLNLVPLGAYLWRASGPAAVSGEPACRSLWAGAALFGLGWWTELIAEVQRARFRRRLRLLVITRGQSSGSQKRTPYTGGLFAWSRHINYLGYTVWRIGLAQCGGGWGLAGVVGVFHAWDFLSRGIPVLEDYCQNRYGLGWQAYERQTPWVFIPFIV